MNIPRFDQVLIKLNHSVLHFCSTKQNNTIYKNIFSYDIKNLIQYYLTVRTILIQHRQGEDAKLPTLSINEFKKRLYSNSTPRKDLDLKSIDIAHSFRTASCFINKDIVRIIKEQQLPELKEVALSKAIFIPISLLPVRYHQIIHNIIAVTYSLSTHLMISIVGSQAMFALLVTLYDTEVDPIDIYKHMDSRDLDIRLVAPSNISDEAFISYIQFLALHMNFNSEATQRSEILPHLKYCTFTDRKANLDLVLTTDNTEFSNCSVAIPLFDWHRVFMHPKALLAISHGQIIINHLEQYVSTNNIIALAYIMKLINLLSPWDFQLSTEQQLIWEKIPEKSMKEIQEKHHQKYLTDAILPQAKLCVPFDEKNFPPLVLHSAGIRTITTGTLPTAPTLQPLQEKDFPKLRATCPRTRS